MDCQATLSISVTQCDCTSATTPLHWPAPATVYVLVRPSSWHLSRGETWPSRCSAGTETVSELAREHEVSRKFLYQQVHTAEQALDRAFAPVPQSEEVLFYLPVTKSWLRQLVLALVFICHSSTRGVVELLRDLFDYRISLGTVHNIVHSAVAPARGIKKYTTSPASSSASSMSSSRRAIRLGGGRCRLDLLLLAESEEHRDADTWGIRLLELADRGFAPQATIADFGSGLRDGHQEALPKVPCRGDVFHALYHTGPLVRYLENRAYEAMDACAKLDASKLPRNVVVAARTRVCPRSSVRTAG